MKKKGIYSANKTILLSVKEERTAHSYPVRPEGYFADALSPEDIELENLIANAVAKKNASHRFSK